MIEVTHLTKRYGGQTAVSDLSFSIDKGQIFGFLGPNGAGKSTTMNILTGCLAPTTGEVRIGGYDIFEDARAAKRLIGYLPELPPLYPERTPREYLNFVAEAKGLCAPQRRTEIDRVLQLTGTADVSYRLIRSLSKGFRQRVGIAQALIGDPSVIILDEPTVGLDPLQITEIRELIRSLGKDHTVLLSSHILSEVQTVCSRVLILSHGKLAASGTTEELEQMFAGRARVNLTAEASVEQVRTLLQDIPDLASWHVENQDGNSVTLTAEGCGPDGTALARELFSAFSRGDCAILSMQTVQASLEDVFLELTTSEAASAEISAAAETDSGRRRPLTRSTGKGDKR